MLTHLRTLIPVIDLANDAGKRAHHCVAIDAAGAVVLSKRVDNDESVLLDLIAAVLTVADGDPVVWATDLNTGGRRC